MTDRRIGQGTPRPASIAPGPAPARGEAVARKIVPGHAALDNISTARRGADLASRQFATIHHLATQARTTPQGLDQLAAKRLRELERISAAAFEAAVSVAPAMPSGAQETRRETKASAQHITAVVSAFAARHGHDQLEKLLRDGGIVKVFQTAYRDTFGVEPVAASLGELVRDFADHLAIYTERPLKLTVASSDKPSPPELREFFTSLLRNLDDAGLAERTAVLGGFNTKGASEALYGAADQHRGVRRLGVMPRSGILEDVARLDGGTISGLHPGDDAPLYWELSAGSVLVCFDLDARGRAHLEHHVREGGTAIILGEAPDDVIGQAEGVLHLRNALRDPRAAASNVTELMRAKLAARSATTETAWLHLGDSDRNVVDVESWAKELTAHARVRQLLDFASDQLRGHPELREHLESLASGIANRTVGIDPIHETAVWVVQVREAFAEGGDALQGCVRSGLLDVVLARWFTPVSRQEEPGYFAANRSRLPKAAFDLQVEGQHSYDVSRYVKFRLDALTRTVVGTPGMPVDVFLGSADELSAYYATQGYVSAHKARRTHGLEFNVLRNADGMRLVVQGVENQQRMIQLGAFLKSHGVSRDKVDVLGELPRVRELNRQLLELELASLDSSIVGVIAPATKASLTAIAEHVGVGVLDLDVRSHEAGPFRFKTVSVMAAGGDTWRTLVLFEPVLGESMADIIEATGKFGARNFSIQGDGVSFVRGDVPGAIHHVDGVVSAKAAKRWTAIDNLSILAPSGATTRATNHASFSPLEQTPAWVDSAIKRGAANSEQEYEHVFDALERLASRTTGDIALQPAVIIHDVLGAGGIEAGKRGAVEARAEQSLARDFVDALGIAGVAGRGEDFVAVRKVKPGVAAKTAAAIDLSTVDTRVPDLATMGDSQAAGSVAQFKGQKAALLLDASAQTPAGRAELTSFLSNLDARAFWVVLDVNDPEHGAANDLARKLGFETVVLGTADDLVSRRLQSSPNFFLKRADRSEVEATRAEFLRHGAADEDANHARSYIVEVKDGLLLTMQSETGPQTTRGAASELAHAVGRARAQALENIQSAIAWRRERLGLPAATMYRTDEQLDAFFAGRKANIWVGFSRLSSADLSPAQRDEAERLVELEALLADPRDYVDVTGATAYGWEKDVQHIKTRPERRFDLLGTITDSTRVDGLALMQAFDELPADWQASFLAAKIPATMRDYLAPLAKAGGSLAPEQVALLDRSLATEKSKHASTQRRMEALGVPGLGKAFAEIFAGRVGWEPSDHIAHLLPVSASWVGQSRQVLMRIAQRFGGQVTNAGGGKIAEDMIRMQFALGVKSHLWSDLEMSDTARAAGKTSAGASVDMAKLHPAHGFASVEEYFKRRGLFSQLEKLAAYAADNGFDIASLADVKRLSEHLRAAPSHKGVALP